MTTYIQIHTKRERDTIERGETKNNPKLYIISQITSKSMVIIIFAKMGSKRDDLVGV